MNCPHCNSSDVIKKGTTAAGSQRLKCKDCAKWFVDLPLEPGRPTLLPDRPMTGYERLDKFLDKKKKIFKKDSKNA